MKIIWTQLAVEKLEEYAEYIALDKPTAALNWAESIQDSVDKLKKFSQIGRKVPEINRADIRELIEENYRIIYRIGENCISILTIRHSKQLLNKTDIKTSASTRNKHASGFFAPDKHRARLSA